MSALVGGLTAPLAALTVTLALAGCGGSSSHTSSPSVAAASHTSATTASSATSTTTAATSHHTPAKHHEPATSSSSASSSTSATTSGTTQSAPSPTPTGTPSAPAGLAQTTGYGTYELCAGTCTGAVPNSVRRPLRIGSGGGCSGGQDGPVRPGAGVLQLQKFLGSSWLGAQVSWTAAASYSGPVLIRGRQAGGLGAVGFGEGHRPYDELQFLDSGQQAPPHPSGTRAWLTLVRVKTAGCYSFQIDTTEGSRVLYLRAS